MIRLCKNVMLDSNDNLIKLMQLQKISRIMKSILKLLLEEIILISKHKWLIPNQMSQF